MAKNQPKLTDITEILLQQVIKLEQTIKQSQKAHLDTIKKLENIHVKVNVAELRQSEQESREQLKNDFENFHQKTTKNNQELLKIHKIVSSKRLLYLIILNVFLLLVTGLSMYRAVKNTIKRSEYDLLLDENAKLSNQLENINQFFNENPKIAGFFRESSQKK